ncbi:BMP family lipoprotein [Limimaricola hongkongensis]|uniref:Putative nucleoside ABC transporter, substrate-binding component n=1 Tax=Limimaricola hongkongensis DSM 17492 TaxID=1122180 RepID=A0A017H8H2_9RHOB|nr:BMP family ABC transporter substrate-binding protein [Limimaricola hongkongensis]EYD70681.1 putative nucleoside ABC transporter, substrate-binding component [Limimaricola hongkongensis DSM 17492]
MTHLAKFLGASAVLALSAGAALADPALVFDLGGKFDKSFNESAHTGATRWAEETGNSYAEVELQSDAQREQALRRFAEAGNNPIVTVGFSFMTPLEEIAADYPDTKFVIVDGVVDLPNVRSVIFNEHEGSYLVGQMAAMASESDTVGFIGGMDIPLIRKFACGYAQGAKAVNPDITVLSNMTGTTPAAWNDPVKGSELTQAQISQGADVVYAAAGGTGIGVLQTAADQGILSIGVDSNQNYLQPGKVLTSMVKRVDNAVYDAFEAGTEIETGINVMGVNNEGVGIAVDEHNEALVTEEMTAAVEDAKAKIASGEIEVHDYMSDEGCPSLDF